MTDATIAAGKDAWTTTAAPDDPKPEPKRPRLQSGVAATYVHLPVKQLVAGKTVSLATYSVPVRGSVAAQTTTVAAVTSGWDPSTLTANNAPTTGASVANAQPALVDGQRIQVDITSLVQAIAAGGDNYGFKVTTNSATAIKLFGFGSGESSHQIDVEYADGPEEPIIVAPLGGSTVLEPVLAWEAGDFGDETTEQASSRVQVNAGAPDAVSPDYDSGVVANTASEWDLSAAAGFVGVDATSYYGRVELNGNGVWSDWTSWVAHAGVVPTITNPGAIAWDPTPLFAGSVSGGTIRQHRWRVFSNATGKKRYDSGWLNGGSVTSLTHQVPKKWRGRRVHVDDREYRVEFLVRDRTDRTPTGDNPGYVKDTQVYTFDDDAAPTPPTNLTVAQVGDSIWSEWSWERSSGVTRRWVMGVGDIIIDVLDPADVETSGTSHTWRTPAVPAFLTNICWVKAIDDAAGKRTTAAEYAYRYESEGVWLASESDEAAKVVLDGVDIGNFRNDDRRAIYSPVGLEYDIDIVYALRGLSGSFVGSIDSSRGRDWEADIATLKAMRSATDEPVRLAYGTVNVPVVLRNVSPGLPSPGLLPHNMEHTVTFEAQQVDEFGED